GDDHVSRRIESHPDVSAGNLKVPVGIVGHAALPVDEAVVPVVDGGFQDGIRNAPPQRSDEVAGTAPGVAVGKDTPPTLSDDPLSNSFSSLQDRAVCNCSAKWRSKRDDGGNVLGTLSGCRARDHSSQAMTNQVDFATGFLESPGNRLIQPALNKKVRTVSIDADTGEIRLIADTRQPGVKLGQIDICAQKAWNDNDSRALAS